MSHLFVSALKVYGLTSLSYLYVAVLLPLAHCDPLQYKAMFGTLLRGASVRNTTTASAAKAHVGTNATQQQQAQIQAFHRSLMTLRHANGTEKQRHHYSEKTPMRL